MAREEFFRTASVNAAEGCLIERAGQSGDVVLAEEVEVKAEFEDAEVLLVALLIERPTGALEFQINQVMPGLRLRVVVGVRLFLCSGLDLRKLGAEELEFGIECIPAFIR